MTSCPFPIGFGGFFQTDPNSIYSGTKWEQKKDVFILAAGDTYPAGSTGGEAQHQLTVDEMPTHKHELMRPRWYIADSADTSTGSIFALTSGITDHGYKDKENLKEAGGSRPHNNMPPYFAMPFWIAKLNKIWFTVRFYVTLK